MCLRVKANETGASQCYVLGAKCYVLCKVLASLLARNVSPASSHIARTWHVARST